jgi:hypothetical protein
MALLLMLAGTGAGTPPPVGSLVQVVRTLEGVRQADVAGVSARGR